MKIRIHVFISGKVQGVFFRASTKAVADSLGVKGWVRNLPDGKVEVMAEGEDDIIGNFVEFLKRGPPTSRVDNVKIDTLDYTGEFEKFTINF